MRPRAPVGNASHVPALDGLRGAAVAGVLLFHTGDLPGGFLGVDLFFVLSGFLITGPLLREARATGRVALVPFWGRRLRRLFPALALVLVTSAALDWALQRAGYDAVDRVMVSTTLSDGRWVQLNLVNWHLLAQDAGYWDAHGRPRVFEHLWSIAVEEQFYLVWPIVIGSLAWTANRFRRQRRGSLDAAALVVATVISGASLLLMIVLLDPADPSRVYMGTDTRAFSLLLGATAATAPVRHVLRRVVESSRRLAVWLVGGLAAAIVAFWLLADGTATPGLFPGGLVGHAVASATLIGLCAALTAKQCLSPERRAPLPIRLLQARPLVRLGDLSYGIYLWHWPVIVLAPEKQCPGLPHGLHSVLVIAASVALAATSKRLVEDPIRFRAPWARGRTGLIVFVVASAALLAMWFVLPAPAAPPIDVGGL